MFRRKRNDLRNEDISTTELLEKAREVQRKLTNQLSLVNALIRSLKQIEKTEKEHKEK